MRLSFALPAFMLSFVLMARAGILSGEGGTIDFTQPAASITFAPADKLQLTQAGLGWDGKEGSVDGSFTTTAIPVGMAWRPLQVMNVTATLRPATQVVRDGVWNGQLYVRYSPDKKHWSTWQPLQVETALQKGTKGVEFKGMLRVPRAESAAYQDLLQAYAKLDVAWKSDEDAAVRWILESQPDFFARQLPFIGYVQFSFEGRFNSGEHATGLDYRTTWGVSGLHFPPKDPEARKSSEGPWRFDATKEK